MFFFFDCAPFRIQLGLTLPPPWAHKTTPQWIQNLSENHVAAGSPPRSPQDRQSSEKNGNRLQIDIGIHSASANEEKNLSVCTPVRYSYPDTSHKGKTSK